MVQNLRMTAKTNGPESQLLHRSFLRGRTYDPLLDEQPEHLPVSLQASRNFYKEGSRANSRMKLRRSVGDMIRLGTSTKIYCRGLLWRMSPRDIHMEAQYTHSDRGWAGLTNSRRTRWRPLAAQDYMKLLSV